MAMQYAFPGRYRPSVGLVWSIRGMPYSRRTRIELLSRGKYAQCLKDHADLRLIAAQTLVGTLQQLVPVDTGSLRASIRLEQGGRNPVVSLGPEPYNRQRMVATLAGRVYRQRKRGRVVLAKYYGIPANHRSGSPSYIERSIDVASKQIIMLCKKFEQVDAEAASLTTAIAGGRPRRRR